MKSIKKLYLIFASVLLVFGACIEPDNVTPVTDGGVLIAVDETSGQFLGLPEDGGFVPLDVALDYELYIPNGISNDVSSYTIMKRFNDSEWVDIATVNQLPYALEYTTKEDFYEGLGITDADLEVGDIFEFWVKVTKNDGTVYYPAKNYGLFKVTVNCLSDLAGVYELTGIYNYAYGGITNQAYGNPAEVIYEISPGQYITSTSGHWAPGALDPGDDGFYFTDVCGTITIEEQYLGGYWANLVAGGGSVDPATGNIHLEYGICYGGNCREYVADYVKVEKADYFADKVEVTNIDANNVK